LDKPFSFSFYLKHPTRADAGFQQENEHPSGATDNAKNVGGASITGVQYPNILPGDPTGEQKGEGDRAE